MDEYERKLWGSDYNSIAGIDEAGRGCLAGPVVAAAVVFNKDRKAPEGIDDSKKLSPGVRESLYHQIYESAETIGVGIVYQKEIDDINILQATYKAMQSAAQKLDTPPDHILVDGNRAPGFGIPCTTIVKGDSKSFSIAAASIIAKVTRDGIMQKIDPEFPPSGFKTNKGYGTQYHIRAIQDHGLSPQHRITFCHKILNNQKDLW